MHVAEQRGENSDFVGLSPSSGGPLLEGEVRAYDLVDPLERFVELLGVQVTIIARQIRRVYAAVQERCA